MDNLWTIAVSDGQSSDGVVTMESTDEGYQRTETSVQSEGANGKGGGEPAPQGRNGLASGQIIMIIIMFVVMYFLLFRGPRKQQKEQAKMRSSIQKNDRVLTIGGIYGTVLDVNDKEVTIKIDEATNAKMKISLSAVSSKIEK